MEQPIRTLSQKIKLFLILLLAGASFSLPGAESDIRQGGSVILRVTPKPDHAPPTQESETGSVQLLSEGTAWVYGRLTGHGFVVSDPLAIVLADADGEKIPLFVETDTLLTEFGEIVGIWFCFSVPSDIADSETEFTLHWGRDAGEYTTGVSRIFFAKAELDRVYGSEIESLPATGEDGEQTSIASIEVVADSSAEYGFLWYLLPMAVLFFILTIRKARTNVAVD